MHAIASVMGGIAAQASATPKAHESHRTPCAWTVISKSRLPLLVHAWQEAIKAATNQYIPLNNTFIFNGANGTTATLEL